jgi:pimeloyl-ACP methyl ester carboxylesterase
MATLNLSGARVEYWDQGEGEPVVLLHSSASSSAQWRSLIERLCDRYRVIAPDLYGYGGTSPWPGRGAFRLEHEAKLVLPLLGKAGGPVHLVGHSFGGAVALYIARTRPDLLASLTVVEPVAFHILQGRDVVALVEMIGVAHRVANALACGDYFGGTAAFVDYWSGTGTWDALAPEKRPGLAACLGKVALDFEATLNEAAMLADFRGLALPTLLVQGTRTPRPTRRICELLASVLPHVEHALVEGAGHMAPLTHRDAVNVLIERHLGTVRLALA